MDQQSDRLSLARILNTVVDQQQQCVLQFADISRALESVRTEIRRTDENHHKEVEGLHDLIKQMMQLVVSSQQQQQARPVQQPQQQAYPVAMPDAAQMQMMMKQHAAFFNDPSVQMMLKQQQQQAQNMQMQQQHLQQMLQLQQQQQQQQIKTGPSVLQSLAQQPLKAPPTPSASGTVSLPVSTPTSVKPAPAPEQAKVEVKKEATPTPATSFGKPAAPAASSSLFGGTVLSGSSSFKFLSPKKDEQEDEDEDAVEEYEPQVDFKPVIPLPDLVEVKTGEEDETVLFEERCKLYRYAAETKEWKERGTGNVKILKNPKSGSCRVVMRREQVHKLCANFKLTKAMKISKMGNNVKACAWHCHDFSEDEPTHEQLSARFATAEIADKFIKLFAEGVESASDAPTPKKEEKPKKADEKKPESGASFGSAFVKKADEWDCQGCYTRCQANQDKCPCCGTNKDGSAGEKDIFTKPAGAAALPTSSNVSFGFETGSTTTAAATAADKPKFSFGLKTEDKPKMSFAAAASAAAKDDPTATVATQKAAGFGAAVAGAPKFSFGGTATPVAAKPGLFSFVKKEEATSTTPTTAAASPVTFSFKPTTPSTASGGSPAIAPGKSIFGGSAPVVAAAASSTTEQPKIFGAGSSTSGGISFAGFAKPAGGRGLFDADAKEKALQELSKLKTSKFGTNVKTGETPKKGGEDEEHDDEEEEDEYEPEVDFKPVIPLPDLIEVKTGEEDETVLFKERCKLYRYIPESKEWKERGTGEIKILKNPATNSQRVVMRREQTHKLCANFSLSKTMSVSKMVKNPKACLWLCSDFSEGQLSREQLSAKFASPELADDFCRLFDEAVVEAAK